jgi:hypothetical protein
LAQCYSAPACLSIPSGPSGLPSATRLCYSPRPRPVWSLAGYRYYQRLLVEVDQELEKQLQVLPAAANAEPKMPKRTKRQPYQKQRNEPEFDLRREVYRIVGVDLTDVPGISAVTAHTIVSEIGTDVSRFRNASAFTSSWGFVRKNPSAAAKSFTLVPGRSRIEFPLRSVQARSSCIRPRTTWASSSAA